MEKFYSYQDALSQYDVTARAILSKADSQVRSFRVNNDFRYEQQPEAAKPESTKLNYAEMSARTALALYGFAPAWSLLA